MQGVRHKPRVLHTASLGSLTILHLKGSKGTGCVSLQMNKVIKNTRKEKVKTI